MKYEVYEWVAETWWGDPHHLSDFSNRPRHRHHLKFGLEGVQHHLNFGQKGVGVKMKMRTNIIILFLWYIYTHK